jgi:anthranilate synthase component 1
VPICQPNIEDARALARGNASIPVYVTLPEATRDPLELFCVFKRLSRHCFMFESLEDPDEWGRYTYLGFDPTTEITCMDGRLTIRNGTSVTLETSNPASAIQQVLEDYRSPRIGGIPPFTGGLVGYFSYDYLRYCEPTFRRGRSETGRALDDQEGFKDIDLMLFDKIVAYDHHEHRIYLMANVRTDALDENYHRAAHELASLATLVAEGEPARVEPLHLLGPFDVLFDEQRYIDMVEQAKRHIYEGDIFQVVLSNRLSAPATGSLFDTYRSLRKTNPSPYMFYFASDDIELAGSSPETLAKLLDGTVYTFPLAGTRPRGATPEEDAALERELLADEKELAEHNMLVDLGRNDVGHVSAFGTVEVERYLDIQRYSHVMHIGSTVTGTLAEGKRAMDVIDAILPAGTLSGAPKIRACEIIDELEGNRRGIYGGAVGYLGFTGNLDTCIAIRLAWLKGGRVFVRSGAGIVADSVPAREYQECRDKMQAVLDALGTPEDVPEDVPDDALEDTLEGVSEGAPSAVGDAEGVLNVPGDAPSTHGAVARP